MTRPRFHSLLGKPRVIAMFFASCHGTCLLTADSMKRIEASLPSGMRDQVGFVLISIDPRGDTSSALRRYRSENQLSASRWTLLRGTTGSAEILATSLGTTFVPSSTRRFLHSPVLTVLDRYEYVIHQQIGTLPDLAKVVYVLNQLPNVVCDKATARTE